ncbi:MAG: ThuA domain-containing protein [Armatimonadetes bacterium]|nr:ThuA domain-containing protein [Armatimonadota bacterium]
MSDSAKIKAAVVTGSHPFDVPAFQAMLRSLEGIDAYPQHMEDFVCDVAGRRGWYDVVCFYNMHTETPGKGGPWYQQPMKAALETLGETGQGIFVLHHALLAFPEWPFWSELVGIRDRSFGYYHGEAIKVEVADPRYPITEGLSDWEMIDETYTMQSAGPDSEILLTVDHPRSMKTVGWTRRFRNARVFCLELGHDAAAFEHPMFRTVVGRGLRWCAGR